MAERERNRIVVGYDGSDASAGALDAALTMADRLGASVDVVTTWGWPTSWSAPPAGSSWSPLHDAEDIRAHAEEQIGRERLDAGTATTRSVEGGAAQVLVESAAGAALLVVGSRGRGGFRGLLLGSVSTACMQHAPCPVMIHRNPTRPVTGSGTVVVGVDGSEESWEALRFALTVARRLGSPVRSVTSWEWPTALNRDEPPFDHWSPDGDAKATAARALDVAADLVGDDVQVTSETVEGPAAEVLIETGRDAAFLVLGNRGLGGFRGLLIGSVSQECAQHATCPVVVHRT